VGAAPPGSKLARAVDVTPGRGPARVLSRSQGNGSPPKLTVFEALSAAAAPDPHPTADYHLGPGPADARRVIASWTSRGEPLPSASRSAAPIIRRSATWRRCSARSTTVGRGPPVVGRRPATAARCRSPGPGPARLAAALEGPLPGGPTGPGCARAGAPISVDPRPSSGRWRSTRETYEFHLRQPRTCRVGCGRPHRGACAGCSTRPTPASPDGSAAERFPEPRPAARSSRRRTGARKTTMTSPTPILPVAIEVRGHHVGRPADGQATRPLPSDSVRSSIPVEPGGSRSRLPRPLRPSSRHDDLDGPPSRSMSANGRPISSHRVRRTSGRGRDPVGRAVAIPTGPRSGAVVRSVFCGPDPPIRMGSRSWTGLGSQTAACIM